MIYSLTLTLIFSKTVPFCNNNALIPDTPALIKISGTCREENYWNASGILTLKILKSQRSRTQELLLTTRILSVSAGRNVKMTRIQSSNQAKSDQTWLLGQTAEQGGI